MKTKYTFKAINNRVRIYQENKVIDEFTVEEFNEICDLIDIFKTNNPVLFDEHTKHITIEDINNIKFNGRMSLGDDFTEGLLCINIRPVYFYKKNYSYLFFDFIYKFDETITNEEYGILNYDVNGNNVVSICIEEHDKIAIKSGFITNSYLRGLFEDELKTSLIEMGNLQIMINGYRVDCDEFWNEKKVVEYDCHFSAAI